MASLVLPEGRLFFKNDASGGWEASRELEGGGEADDAAADYGDVEGTARQDSGPYVG